MCPPTATFYRIKDHLRIFNVLSPTIVSPPTSTRPYTGFNLNIHSSTFVNPQPYHHLTRSKCRAPFGQQIQSLYKKLSSTLTQNHIPHPSSHALTTPLTGCAPNCVSCSSPSPSFARVCTYLASFSAGVVLASISISVMPFCDLYPFFFHLHSGGYLDWSRVYQFYCVVCKSVHWFESG